MNDIDIYGIQLLFEKMESNLKIWLPGTQIEAVGLILWP